MTCRMRASICALLCGCHLLVEPRPPRRIEVPTSLRTCQSPRHSEARIRKGRVPNERYPGDRRSTTVRGMRAHHAFRRRGCGREWSFRHSSSSFEGVAIKKGGARLRKYSVDCADSCLTRYNFRVQMRCRRCEGGIPGRFSAEGYQYFCLVQVSCNGVICPHSADIVDMPVTVLPTRSSLLFFKFTTATAPIGENSFEIEDALGLGVTSAHGA